MKFLAAYTMRGRMQAVMTTSTLAFFSMVLPPVSIFSSATVSLVTLRKGALEGFFVLLSACAAMAILGALVLGNFQFALSYGLILWVPIWLISIILREAKRLSLTFEAAVALGAVGVIGFFLYHPDPAALWKNMLSQMIEPMLSGSDLPVDQVMHSVDVFSRYMTGVAAAASISSLLLGLLLARWWQATLFNPGGFRREFLSLNTRPVFALGSIAVMGLAWMTEGTAAERAGNITILLFVLYGFIGAAVLHVLISTMKARRLLLPLFYVIIFFIPHALLPVALLGLGDAWMDLRKKVLN